MLRTFGAILFLYLFLVEASGQSFNDIPDEDVLDFQRNREFSLFFQMTFSLYFIDMFIHDLTYLSA